MNTELESAWPRLLELAEQRRRRPAHHRQRRAAIDALLHAAGETPEALGESMDETRGQTGPEGSGNRAIRLYTPLLEGCQPFAIGHLGQSIDGCIATASGHSLYVTGHQNLVHLHRLRALSDAVLVGAGTATADDPRLTVRHVAGPSPVRIVIDPSGSVAPTLGLFTDRGPETLVVLREGSTTTAVSAEHCIRVPQSEGRLSPLAIREALARRGLHCLFVEGGGVTVSDWVLAGALDRLHVAVAPVLIGDGRRGLSLPSALDMPSALRPPATRHAMGEDVLFDLDLRACDGSN